MLREDPKQAGLYVDLLQEGTVVGPAQVHTVFHVIANKMGKHPREIDFMSMNSRDAVRAFIPKALQSSFDWEAFEQYRRDYLLLEDGDDGVDSFDP
tara:strand:+ start:206 stop:493 length:288 start_codon:yes stop_codon:yes gene_type:complete